MAKSNKIRLDVALCEQGFAPSREKAKAIMLVRHIFFKSMVFFFIGYYSCFAIFILS